MYILSTGMGHHTTPIEVREKFVFTKEKENLAYQLLSNEKNILESVIISTCNRTEIIAVVDQVQTGHYSLKKFLSSFFNVDLNELEPYLFLYENQEAVHHLFKVAAGLDSLVLGETQILGQVKAAFSFAQKEKATGPILNQLFKDVIFFAKKVHEQSKINENAVSISYVAVEVAKKMYHSLDNKKILLLGAGKMAELALQNLTGSGAKEVNIINRTEKKAFELSEKFSAHVKKFSNLAYECKNADIIIVSTGAEKCLITYEMMVEVMKQKSEPLLLIDIALPRNVEACCVNLPNLFLYDLDHLGGVINMNMTKRKKIMATLEDEITTLTNQFYKWIKQLRVVPVICKLRENALSIQTEAMKSLENKIPNLTEREYIIIGKHMKSIINQLLKKPIAEVKEMAILPDTSHKIEIFKQIFDIQINER